MTSIISGKVIRGKGKGKKIGFPTVNIKLSKKVESGVYSGIVRVAGQEYRSGIFVGLDKNNLEAYLIGFSGDLYGKTIEVDINKKIRDVEKIGSEDELKEKIEKDIKVICES